jgi:hypothetical protein
MDSNPEEFVYLEEKPRRHRWDSLVSMYTNILDKEIEIGTAKDMTFDISNPDGGIITGSMK